MMKALIMLALLLAGLPVPASAEWYIAGQFGGNFADRLSAVRGTGIIKGLDAPDFPLKTSYAYGGKIGVYPGHYILGAELDVLYSNPHIKNLDEIPGIHLNVTNIGLHLLMRYPGATYQPYGGIGPAILVSRLGRSDTTQADTNVTVGLDLLLGLRAFIAPTVGVFTEYKYTLATLRFTDAFADGSGFHGDYRVHQLVVGMSYHF